MITFETRLRLTKDQESLISGLFAAHSKAVKRCFAMDYRQKLDESAVYHRLKSEGNLTAGQIQSAQNVAKMIFNRQVEVDKYLKSQLEASIVARKKALREAKKDLEHMAEQLKNRQELAQTLHPSKYGKKSKAYAEALAKIRSQADKIQRKQRWIKMKELGLAHKEQRLKMLCKRIESNKVSICFGSKKLLAQNPKNNSQSTFESYEQWRARWDLSRNNQIVSIGQVIRLQTKEVKESKSEFKDKPGVRSNKEIFWDPQSKILKVRLTDEQALSRMRELALSTGLDVVSGNSQKCRSLRMQARFIEIPDVDFTGHLDKETGISKAALMLEHYTGKAPITAKIIIRQDNAEFKYYLHLTVPAEAPAEFATSARGALGLDFNAKGVAWSVVKPCGNLQSGEQGFIKWDVLKCPSGTITVQTGTVAKQLAAIAVKHNVAIAIENLDFADAKSKVTASYVDAKGRKFNAVLSSLATSEFKKMIQKQCRESGIGLYFANPTYSSVGGFAKYGYCTKASVDEAASHWIARQALFGAKYKKREFAANEFGCKLYKEKLSPHGQPYSAKRSKSAAAGLTWRAVSLALGSKRHQWSKNLRKYLLSKVATASPTAALAAGDPGKGVEEKVCSTALLA